MSDKSEDKNNKNERRRRQKRKRDEDNDDNDNVAHATEIEFVEVPFRVKKEEIDQPNTTESSTPYTVTSSHPVINTTQHESVKSECDNVTLETANILMQLKLNMEQNLSNANFKTEISWSHSPIKPDPDQFEDVDVSAPVHPASSLRNSNNSNMPSSSDKSTQTGYNNYHDDKRNIGDLHQSTLSRSDLTLQRRQNQSQMDHPPHACPSRRRTLLSPSELEEANRNQAVRHRMLAHNRSMRNFKGVAVDLLPASASLEVDRPRRSVATSTHATIQNINDSISRSLHPTLVRRRGRSAFDERLSHLRNRQDSSVPIIPPPYQTGQSVPYSTMHLTMPNENFVPALNQSSLRFNQSSHMLQNEFLNCMHHMPRCEIGQAVSLNNDNQNLNLSREFNSPTPSHVSETVSHLGGYINQQFNYGFPINQQTTQITEPNVYSNEEVCPQFGFPSGPLSGRSNHMGNEYVNQPYNFYNNLNQARFIYDEPTQTNQIFQPISRQGNRQFMPNTDLTRHPYQADFMLPNQAPIIHRPINEPSSTISPTEHRFLVPEIPKRRTSRSRNKSVKKTPPLKPSNSTFMRGARDFPRRTPGIVTPQHEFDPQTMTFPATSTLTCAPDNDPQTMTFPATSTMTCAPDNESVTTMFLNPTLTGEPETPMPFAAENSNQWISSSPSLLDLDSMIMSTPAPVTSTPETPMSIAEEQASLNNVPDTINSTPQTAPLVNSTSTSLSATTTLIAEAQQRIFTPDVVQISNDVATTTVSTSEAVPISAQEVPTVPSSLFHIQNVAYPLAVFINGQESPVIMTSKSNDSVTLNLPGGNPSVTTTAQSETVSAPEVHSTVTITSALALTAVIHPPNTRLTFRVTHPNAPQQRLISPHIAVVETPKNPPSTTKEQSNALERRWISPHISVIQTPQNPPPMSKISNSTTQMNTLPPIETVPPMPPLIEMPTRLRTLRRFRRPQGGRSPNRTTGNVPSSEAHVPEVAHTNQASSESIRQPMQIYNSSLYRPIRPYSAGPDFYVPQRRHLPQTNTQPNQIVPEEVTDETNGQNAPDN